MSYLTSELSDLLLTFVKNSSLTESNKLRVPKDFKLLNNEVNFDLAIDAVRCLVFNGGIYQIYGLINNLPRNAEQKFCLEAYDNALKMINFVLFPLPFPLKCYQKCCMSVTILLEIADQMSVDLELLNELFKPIVKYDKFVRDLLRISNEVYGSGGRNILEDLRTYVCRSDFFVHIDDLKDPVSDFVDFCKYCQYDNCLCQYGRKANPPAKKELEFKLVEINLGGCSLSHYSAKIHKVHDKILTTTVVDPHEFNKDKTRNLLLEKEKFHLHNDPNPSFTYPISETHKAYLQRYNPIFGDKRVCILVIPDNTLHNYFDTYFISNDVFEKYGIHVKTAHKDQLVSWMKKKMLFLASNWEYNPDGSVNFTEYSCYQTKLRPGRLVLNLGTDDPDFKSMKGSNGCFEFSTVYIRDMYDSIEMADKDYVYFRKFIEFSDAVSIPNVLYQLVNTKRAQLYFSDPKNVDTLLEKFNKRVTGVKRNTGLTDLVKKTAILQVDPSLDSNSEVVEDAIKNPSKYVLKPNREIGRGIMFDEELSRRLKRSLKDKKELSQYVLMKKITTPRQPTLFVKHLKNGAFQVRGFNSLTEVGIYHYAMYDGNECVFNDSNGYLARTKPDFAKGGGIGAGVGFVNSLLLF